MRRDHRHARLDDHPHDVPEHLVDAGTEEHLVNGNAVKRGDGAAQIVRLGSLYQAIVSMARRMASAAPGETPKALSFAPTRTRNASPRRRSSVSGPTNGTVAGRLSTSLVKRGVVVIVACPPQIGRENTAPERHSVWPGNDGTAVGEAIETEP